MCDRNNVLVTTGHFNECTVLIKHRQITCHLRDSPVLEKYSSNHSTYCPTYGPHSRNFIPSLSVSLCLSIMLRSKVSRPASLPIKLRFEAYNEIFITVRLRPICYSKRALSEERTGLLFTIAVGPRQRSRFRVLVLWSP
jgi:hypothetical protein